MESQTNDVATLFSHSCPKPIQLVEFICRLAQDGKIGSFGSFSPSLYDTAWLAMVPNKPHEKTSWLFPSAFDALLDSQNEDGVWSNGSSIVDCLIDSLAALLAMVRRKESFDAKSSLWHRIEKARYGLKSLLQKWDVTDVPNMGFEIIIPSLI